MENAGTAVALYSRYFVLFIKKFSVQIRAQKMTLDKRRVNRLKSRPSLAHTRVWG